MTSRQALGNFVALALSAALIAATIFAINVRLTQAAYEIENDGPQVEKEIDDSFVAPAPCSGYTLAHIEYVEPGDPSCESDDEVAKQSTPLSDEIADEQPLEGDCFEVELARYVEAGPADAPTPCGNYELSL